MLVPQSILTVSQITRRIKSVLETDFSSVAIQGEISNFKRHTSGHLYFTLKDESCQIQAVMWRSRAVHLLFTPQDGMKVIVRGAITVYEVRGSYQIDVFKLQPLGAGELQLAFERLKQKLAEEGLFDPEHKKPLPPYPRKIGIVTSPTGAAIEDMCNILQRRYPVVEVVLAPVRVQGIGAAEEIATAIRDLNRLGDIDVIIVGRGGGSLEDLWAFNEEIVARAIYGSAIPVISAVGHEIDFTIADFVADLRAPTPSAAAELVVPERRELVDIVRNFCYTAEQSVSGRLTAEKDNVLALLRTYSFNRPYDLVRQYSQQLDDLQRSIVRSVAHRVLLLREKLVSLEKRMGSVNPLTVLERGYSIVLKDGKMVPRANCLESDDRIDIRFFDAEVPAKVKEFHPSPVPAKEIEP